MKHEIKIEPQYLNAILEGRKTFEVRYNDRGYNANDELAIIETEWPHRKISAKIGYVTGFNQQENWVVFSLLNVKEISE